jgi:hypothetical protein
MDQPNGASEKSALNEMDAALKRLHKTWGAAKKARKEWDFKTAGQTLDALTEDFDKITTRWQGQQQVIREGLQRDQEFVASDAYPSTVEAALKASGIPIKGEFPIYEFPPFKLTFSRETGVIRLSMGRRSQQTKSFAPEHVATWVTGHYRRVIDSKFDAPRFCRELLAAYELANRLVLNESTVRWGNSVPLKDLYKLLTLKQSAKQDYPEVLFTYDLALLQEQFDICYEGYLFEFVPSRNQSTGLLLVNSRGQESRVMGLIIHPKEDATEGSTNAD